MTTTDTPTLPLAAGRWAVDTNHSSVGFTVRHLGVSKVRGQFTGFEADVVIGDTLDATSVVATVDLSSLDTANADRDAHVLSPDILHVEQRPTLVFRSTAVTGEGNDWSVDGEATIGGETRPLTLAVELGGVQEFPADGRRHAGFEATAQLRRTDFGIGPGIPGAMLGDVIKIELDLQLIEPEAPTAV